jgi:hypothetical protein
MAFLHQHWVLVAGLDLLVGTIVWIVGAGGRPPSSTAGRGLAGVFHRFG